MPILVGFFFDLIIIFRTKRMQYIHVATLWSCSSYFLCSLSILLQKRTMLWKTWFLLPKFIFSVWSKHCSLQMLYFTWHTWRCESCLILPGSHLCHISYKLNWQFLYFICADQSPLVQPLMCAYGSGGEFPISTTMLSLFYRSSLVSSSSTLELLYICDALAIKAMTTGLTHLWCT
jgi:hypothetical protein